MRTLWVGACLVACLGPVIGLPATHHAMKLVDSILDSLPQLEAANDKPSLSSVVEDPNNMGLLTDEVPATTQEATTPKQTHGTSGDVLVIGSQDEAVAKIKTLQQELRELKKKIADLKKEEDESKPKPTVFEEEQRALLTSWAALNLPLKWKDTTLHSETVPKTIHVLFGGHEMELCSADLTLPSTCSRASPLVTQLRGTATEAPNNFLLEEFGECKLENSKMLYVGVQDTENEQSPMAAACVSFKLGSDLQTRALEVSYQSSELPAPIRYEFKASELPGNENPDLFRTYLSAIRDYRKSIVASTSGVGFAGFISAWSRALEGFATTPEFAELKTRLPELEDQERVAQLNTMIIFVVVREAATSGRIPWEKALKFLPTIPSHKGFLKFVGSDKQSRENSRIVANNDIKFGLQASLGDV